MRGRATLLVVLAVVVGLLLAQKLRRRPSRPDDADGGSS